MTTAIATTISTDLGTTDIEEQLMYSLLKFDDKKGMFRDPHFLNVREPFPFFGNPGNNLLPELCVLLSGHNFRWEKVAEEGRKPGSVPFPGYPDKGDEVRRSNQ